MQSGCELLGTIKPYGQETGDGYSEFRTLTSEELAEVHCYFVSIEIKAAI